VAETIRLIVSPEVAFSVESNNPFLPFIAAMGPKLWVGAIDGEPAGFAGREHNDHRITDLWVAPHFEGRGVGTALVTHLETTIRADGYRRAQINVAALNHRALSLYQHLGYEVTWRGNRFDPVLGIELEKCHLEKALN
jgi:ribosomal-protein-alanine N-acetyltransferase